MFSDSTESGAQGQALTARARACVLEGAWRKGYQLLMAELPASAAEHVQDVLRGRQSLQGASPFTLQPDQAETQLAAQLAEKLNDCFEFAHAVFRPYGVADKQLPENAQFAQKFRRGASLHCTNLRLRQVLAQQGAGLDPTSQLRALPMLRNPLTDLVLAESANAWPSVLCEKVNFEVPPWYAPQRDCFAVAEMALRNNQLPVIETPAPSYAGLFNMEATPPLAPTRPDTSRLAAAIAEFAAQDTDYGWLMLNDVDPVTRQRVSLRVPRRAFICCALHMAGASQLMPAYRPICPVGLKMPNDSPFHSDAWLGAGMRADQAYAERLPEQRLFMRELGKLQRALLGCSFTVLAKGPAPSFAGTVVHDLERAGPDKVLVLGTASPDAASAARACAGVIVETGSQLAHLVVVSREAAVPVIRIEGARSRFPSGRDVTVDFARGTAELLMPA